MALERTFREFATQLSKLDGRLRELEITVVEDKPPRHDAVIVDTFEYAVCDLRGWVKEARRAADEAERAVDHPVDIESARRALTHSQEQFGRVEHGFAANLVSYERLKDLTSFGAERGGEWFSWATTVKQGIEQCRPPVEEARQALAACWQEIAERVGMTSVSVRTKNIGQKIVAKASEVRETAQTEFS